jgi:hypothetical protein
LPSKAVRQALAEQHSAQALAPRLEAVPLEAVRLEAVPLEAVPLEAVPLEAVRLEAVRLEAVRLEAVRLEAVRLEAVRLETPPLEEVSFPQPAASLPVDVPAPISGVVARPRSRRVPTLALLCVGALVLGAGLVLTTARGDFGQRRAAAEPKPLVAPRPSVAPTPAGRGSPPRARAAPGEQGKWLR